MVNIKPVKRFDGRVTMSNPWGIDDVPYEKPIVDFVDVLLEVAKKNGSKSLVQTSYDWNTIDFMYKGWKILYPQTSQAFEDHMKEWRRQSTHLGVSREAGGATLQHQLELPRPINDMMRVIFPEQKWDKKFTKSFVNHFGQFRGSDKL